MPRYTQLKKTWFYPVDFKIKAVELSLNDNVMSKDVAQALDIHPLMLCRWRKEFMAKSIPNVLMLFMMDPFLSFTNMPKSGGVHLIR